MNTSKKRPGSGAVITIALVVALLVLIGVRANDLGSDEAVAGVRDIQAAEGIPVETVAVERGDLAEWITLAGTVEGAVQYAVISNNSLRVRKVLVAEGDRVDAGDPVILLADEAPTPMVHSASRSKVAYENAELETERLRNLFAEGAVSQSDLDAAEANLRMLKTDYVNAAGATTLRAGEAGVVSRILVEEGETVDVGKPLVWVTDTASVKIVFSAGSGQALELAVGQKAVWTTPEGDERAGAISRLDLMADPENHLLEGEATFDNEDGRLLPGLLVSFRVRTNFREAVLTVPAGCVADADGADAVWTAEGTASLTTVTLGLQTTDSVEVVSGLIETQQVVRHGQTLLSEGAKVRTIGVGEEH